MATAFAFADRLSTQRPCTLNLTLVRMEREHAETRLRALEDGEINPEFREKGGWLGLPERFVPPMLPVHASADYLSHIHS